MSLITSNYISYVVNLKYFNINARPNLSYRDDHCD